jgi:hypothetical protein
MFMMSFFEISKGVIKKLDQYSSLLWQGGKGKKKYCLAKWTYCVTLKAKDVSVLLI